MYLQDNPPVRELPDSPYELQQHRQSGQHSAPDSASLVSPPGQCSIFVPYRTTEEKEHSLKSRALHSQRQNTLKTPEAMSIFLEPYSVVILNNRLEKLTSYM